MGVNIYWLYKKESCLNIVFFQLYENFHELLRVYFLACKLDCSRSYIRNVFVFGISSKIATNHFGYSHLQ